MKKPLITIAIILISTACTNNTALSDEVAELNNKIEELRAINYELLDEINNRDEITDDFQVKNVVVQKPVEREVTYEVWEKLIGRYETVDGYFLGSYFEIKPDGSAEIQIIDEIHDIPLYSSEQLYIKAYYILELEDSQGIIFLSFNLTIGTTRNFPGNTLSFTLNGNPDDLSFYNVESYRGLFVKVE
ncbi:MAG: hypothetical protein FWH20_04555 [Oscillospiraceae bacterium]|nr:hypothetical protein [Oscillospiraceae bacterium]